MRLNELVVEDFRKLAGRYVVRPAPTGLTIVSGDNEEGKSTLLEALKRAFFMKHNTSGDAREAIQPHSRDVTPSVVVSFAIGEQTYRLEKRFRRNGVRLEGPDGALEGDAAELALAQLLAFEWPGRGAAKPEHMGLAGLFWVDQGTTFNPEQRPSPTALQSLEPALAEQVAALERGEYAPRLMAEIRRQRDQHWTGARGQPRGELVELQGEIASLQAALEALTAAEAQVESLLERLARTIEKRRAWVQADQLGRARRDIERTRSALARVQAMREEQRLRQARLETAQSEQARLRAAAERRRSLQAEIATKRDEQQQLVQAQATAAPLLERARRRRQAEEAAEADARKALATLERDREAATRQAERLRLESELAALDRLNAAVDTATETAAGHAAAAAAEAIDARCLAGLEQLETAIGEANAALRAVATRIRLRPERPDAAARLDDRAIEPMGSIELTEPAILVLEGYGQIEVTPGGERLATLKSTLHEARSRLDEGLGAVAASSVGEARRRFAAKERHEREATAARQTLADLLRANGAKDARDLQARRAALRLRLAGLDDVLLADHTDETMLETARLESERALAAAREHHAGLTERRQAAADEERELAKEADLRLFAEARIAAEIARLGDQLAIERDERDDETLAAALRDATARADEASEAALRIERELERASPDATAQEAEQAARRLAQLEAEAANLDRDVDRLEAELKGTGGRGVGDEKAMVKGRLELAERRYARLLATAQAWRLLHDTMQRIDHSRQDALVAPLKARIQPYIQQLMGDATLGFAADGLQIDALRRGSIAEPFGSLSVGTREQIAVLVRLAIGDVLHEGRGRCPPLILDDALVYADAVRLARMKTILEQAARRHQIIVLTCRKEDYLGLDARYLTLEECREVATA